MAKQQSDAPINEQDIAAYLQESDSFQFELDVFQSCLKFLDKAEHSGFYVDPLTSKDRQFDIRAWRSTDMRHLKLAVECKRLRPNFPLVVNRLPRTVGESYCDVLIGAVPGPFINLARFKGVDSYFLPGSPVAKTMAQVGKREIKEGGVVKQEVFGSDSELFDKWTQAVASSHQLVRDSVGGGSYVQGNVQVTLVMPILVVSDATLWAVDFSTDGKRQGKAQQIEECSFYLGKDVPTISGVRPYCISHLLIFTKAGFDKFLKRITSYEDEWQRIFSEKAVSREYRR